MEDYYKGKGARLGELEKIFKWSFVKVDGQTTARHIYVKFPGENSCAIIYEDMLSRGVALSAVGFKNKLAEQDIWGRVSGKLKAYRWRYGRLVKKLKKRGYELKEEHLLGPHLLRTIT